MRAESIFNRDLASLKKAVSEIKDPDLQKQATSIVKTLSVRFVNAIAYNDTYRGIVRDFIHEHPSGKDLAKFVEGFCNQRILDAKLEKTRLNRIAEKKHMIFFFRNQAKAAAQYFHLYKLLKERSS